MNSRSKFSMKYLALAFVLIGGPRCLASSNWFQQVHDADQTDAYQKGPYQAFADLELDSLPPGASSLESDEFIQLDSGKKLRAVLYSTGQTGKLALVRCGIFCQGKITGMGKFAARIFMSPTLGYSHVLIVGSTSGLDYWQDNLSLDLGGFAEAKETDELLVEMDRVVPRIANLVNHVTLVGISLGGHASLSFSVLQSQGLLKSQGVSEVINLCPVVDLKTSFGRLFDGDLISAGIQHKLGQQLSDVASLSPLFDQIYTQFHDLSGGSAKRDYLWQQIETTQSTKDFEDFSDLSGKLGGNTIPTLILQAKDDFMVKAEDNAEKIQQPTENNNLSVEFLKYGSHCAFDEVYPTDMLVAGFQAFLTAAQK